MQHNTRRFWLCLLQCCLLIAGAFASLSPLTAHAASTEKFPVGDLHPHRAASANGGVNVAYFGGPVMNATNNVYHIFWEPTGSVVTPRYNRLLNRYAQDVGTSSLYHNNIQYTEYYGPWAPRQSVLAGRFLDTNPYPANPMTDTQVQNEITAVMNLTGWQASNHNIFFVYTAQGENICASFGCSFQVFCGYHSFFGSTTIYSVVPYPGNNTQFCPVPSSPNGDLIADNAISVTSHEEMEAATDPLLNAWKDPTNGYEIGDKCYGVFGPLDPYGADVNWNGHPYIVQEEWDNAQNGCVLAGP